MKIHTITFDFWGTLLYDGPSSDERYKRRRLTEFQTILAAEGVATEMTALDAAYTKGTSWLGRLWTTHRDVPVDGHVQAIVDAVEPDLYARLAAATQKALVDAYSRQALLVPPAVDDGAFAALDALCARGYTMAVVSNTMRTPGVVLRMLLQKYRLLAFFKHTTFSDEVAIRKPDPEIFHMTLRAVGGEPAHALHVGDDGILDVQGARAARMRVVQVTDASMRALGVQAPDAVVRSLAALPDAVAALDR